MFMQGKQININEIPEIEPQEAEIYLYSIILVILFTLLFIKIIYDIYIKHYQNKLTRPTKQQIKRKEKWKRETTRKTRIDPEMFSNEPLDYQKAKNLKYKEYTEAQWKELNK